MSQVAQPLRKLRNIGKCRKYGKCGGILVTSLPYRNKPLVLAVKNEAKTDIKVSHPVISFPSLFYQFCPRL